jgi:hypothetical protein
MHIELYYLILVSSIRVDVKGIVRPFEFRGETRLIRSDVRNWRPSKVFLNFNHKVS